MREDYHLSIILHGKIWSSNSSIHDLQLKSFIVFWIDGIHVGISSRLRSQTFITIMEVWKLVAYYLEIRTSWHVKDLQITNEE